MEAKQPIDLRYPSQALRIRLKETQPVRLFYFENNTCTHCAPFPLNSSPNATPRARINRRLKVEAVLIPVGNPVTFFTKRIPAGPSWKHIEGTPNRATAVVSPTQRPVRTTKGHRQHDKIM